MKSESSAARVSQMYHYKILLVEDSKMNQIVICEALKHLGYAADTVENGLLGFEAWQNGQYDLVLTDCNMPVLDGYEMVRRIRKTEREEKTARTTIVAISGYSLQEERDRCITSGMNDVLQKPVEVSALKQCLEKWLTPKATPSAPSDQSSSSATVPSAQSPVVDLSVLSQLVGNNLTVQQKLLNQFLVQATEDIKEIVQAFDCKSSRRLASASHRLKSSSRSIGAFTLGDYCASLELKATLVDWAALSEIKTELLDTWQSVRKFLAKGPKVSYGFKDHSTLSILIIDDDQYMLDLVKATFSGMGIEKVACVDSGALALEKLDSGIQPIDIIFCDLNMPKMDGIELLRKLAARNFAGSIALISSEEIGILRAAERLAKAHGLRVLGKVAKPLTPNAVDTLLSRYEPASREKEVIQQGPITAKMLQESIDNDQIEVYFQPQLNVASKKIGAVETLARWQHPTFGTIAPNVFIPLAESSGLINQITKVVFKKAVRQAGIWSRSGFDIRISVNVSVDDLTCVDLPEFCFAETTRHGVKPSQVVLEVTESRLLKNLTVSLDVLTRLRLKGFGLSIDDFGTGYSSMEQLLNVPFTELKIDRAFVHGASKDPAARAILESSVNLAKKLELYIVAEGTENSEDLAFVRSLGCNLVQGNYYSEPMPADEFNEWLKDSA